VFWFLEIVVLVYDFEISFFSEGNKKKDGLNDGVEWLGIGCHPTFPM